MIKSAISTHAIAGSMMNDKTEDYDIFEWLFILASIFWILVTVFLFFAFIE